MVEDETRPTPVPLGEPMPEANATHPLSAAAGFPSLSAVANVTHPPPAMSSAMGGPGSVEDNVVASPAPAGRPALFHFSREVA